MKKIFSSPIVGEIPRLQSMLEGAGIACLLRNEISAGLAPDVPMAEGTPELWIQDDHRLAEALRIKADFQSSATIDGKDWRCQKCGEISEPQFSSCWKCGATRSEQMPVDWIQPDPPAPAPDKKEMIEEAEGGTPCVDCGKLIAAGTKLCPFCEWTQP